MITQVPYLTINPSRCTIAAMNPLAGVPNEAWQMYKAHARHLLAIAFVIYLLAGLLAASLALAGPVGDIFGFLVYVLAAFLLQAALTKAVQNELEGRADLSIGDTVSAATPFIGPVAIASILAGIAITIGLFLLIVPGLILLTIWAVIIPVIVIERSGALESFGRSQQLVRGRGWQVFGTLVLLYIIQIVAGALLAAIFAALPNAYRDGLTTVISGTLVAPYLALGVTLIYYRLAGGDAGSSGGETTARSL
jgi:hypothetical protein